MMKKKLKKIHSLLKITFYQADLARQNTEGAVQFDDFYGELQSVKNHLSAIESTVLSIYRVTTGVNSEDKKRIATLEMDILRLSVENDRLKGVEK